MGKHYLTFLLILFFLFLVSYTRRPSEKLHLVVCNVGQGDAILISHRNVQFLIDGGPNESVLDCLARHMPFWDRKLEVVLLTHPHLDHYGGLIEVVRRYEVDNFVGTSLESSSESYQVLKKEIGGMGVKVVSPVKGMVIRSGLMYLDIVYQGNEKLFTNNVLGESNMGLEANANSVVTKLGFGEFSALLTGDIQDSISDLISKDATVGDIDYIKIPHHGSRNGVSKMLLESFRPEIAVISAGKENRYGHPHSEVVDMLFELGVKTYYTFDGGDVDLVTDGKKYWINRAL